MKERPILFSGPMVRAIFDGRKMQTRRVITPQPDTYHENRWSLADGGYFSQDVKEESQVGWRGPVIIRRCPYGAPGDRLWVREAWAVRQLQAGLWVEYKADSSNARLPEAHDLRDEGGKIDLGRLVTTDTWRPSIFMPRWASRLTLEVVSVRVERVQDISEADAQREGVTLPERTATMYNGIYRAGFARLWDSINSARGYGWDANPWVWCVEFKRVQS